MCPDDYSYILACKHVLKLHTRNLHTLFGLVLAKGTHLHPHTASKIHIMCAAISLRQDDKMNEAGAFSLFPFVPL